jgi:phosphoglycerate dehydrogenase-like enzyme
MKVIIPEALSHYLIPKLAERYPDIIPVTTNDAGVPNGDVHDAVVYVRWWNEMDEFRRTLEAAPLVRWVYTPSAGIEHMDLAFMRQRNIVLTNAAGVHGIPIAEWVMLYLLSHAKKAFALHNFPRDSWYEVEQSRLDELDGKTMAILGLGGIGQETAKRAQSFGMRVIGSRRTPQPTPFVDHVVGDDDWKSLLPEADVLVIATPSTDRTRGMVDAAALALLKPKAYLINVGRGDAIDTPALIDALKSGRLAGAGLDVAPEEPLPIDHPLWDAPNIWITPHVTSSSPNGRKRMMGLFLDNLERFRAGQPLHNVVNYDEGY